MSTTVSFTGNTVNNETPFCRVYNTDLKNKIEKKFYKNRISFFIRWEEQGLLKRIFNGETKERQFYVFYIHQDETERAENLIKELNEEKNIKILTVK